MNLDLYRPIDLYCERISPEFWAEPMNALTNGFFIFVAFIGVYWSLAIPQQYSAHRRMNLVLSLVVFQFVFVYVFVSVV